MICAVVLAAGRSQRMRTQKLLLPLGGKPVIALVVDEILRGPVERVRVVVGADSERIKGALAGRAVTFILNPDLEGDMLSSVRCGLRSLPAACEAVLVVLGDQPTIRAELISDIVQSYRKLKRGIIVPTYLGRHGHPMLFAARFCDEVLERFDTVGLRGLLRSHADEVLELGVAAPTVLEDMDTPEDYERHRARTASNSQQHSS